MKMPVDKAELWFIGARGLLWQMTLKDFRSKYVGSLMGVFWTVLNPLLLLLIFSFVFTVVFRAKFGEQAGFGSNALYILAGILPWVAFQEGIGRASTVLLEHRNLINRVRFPGEILPGVSILSGILGQLIGFAILIILAAVYMSEPGMSLGMRIIVSVIILPVILVLQFAFSLGLAWAVSAFSVYLRDFLHLIPVLLLVWMLGTPIFYPSSLVPERYQVIININPVAHLVSVYRSLIIQGSFGLSGLKELIILAAFALTSLLVGALIYRKLSPGFADQL
jgi:lipopolysaccharide transport system permease protein